MLVTPLSLLNLSQITNPLEHVPAADRSVYHEAYRSVEQGDFERYTLSQSSVGGLVLDVFWRDTYSGRISTVRIEEGAPRGPLEFSCSDCTEVGRQALSCRHQLASFVLLWKALTAPPEELRTLGLTFLAAELKGPEYLGAALHEASHGRIEFEGIGLDSISLFLDEKALFEGLGLPSFLKENLSRYRYQEVAKGEEFLSPRLWNLPEIFRKKLTAYSEHSLHETNRQNRLVDMMRYNFSNGVQISAKDILRHPLQKKVPAEFLPQSGVRAPVFAKWPLVQNIGRVFIGQALVDLEEIIQVMLSHIVDAHRKKKIDLYLQNKNVPGQAMKIESVEYNVDNELDWRVEFKEGEELEAEFKLVCFRRQLLSFYESFALDSEARVLIVHPWLVEFHLLKETLAKVSDELTLAYRDMPTVDVIGELESRSVLKYLRSRSIPTKITGESRTVSADRSRTDIHLADDGSFNIQHQARIPSQKDFIRKGWSTKADLYLQAMTHGLPFFLGANSKEIASRSRSKREWDLKLLKHLGIFHYIFLETLACHFDGMLTDGTQVKKQDVLSSLHEKIHGLLVVGTGSTFVRDVPLTDLVSNSVLVCFDDFIRLTFKALGGAESFFSESGEVVMEGVVEREFRLLYQLLKHAAFVSHGEIFRKSRGQLITKCASLQESLEAMQSLMPFGFKIFYKEQPIEELEEDEFHVDFLLQTEGDQKTFNWFELNPTFFLRGQEVDPDKFLSLGSGGVIEYEGRLFLVPQKQLPSLRRLERFWQRLQKNKKGTVKKKSDDKIYQLPRSQTLELLALRASGVSIRGDNEWKSLCEFYDSLGGGTRDLKLPESVKADLKPYQIRGVQWLQDLYRLRLGALLADDMGLGKTLQTLAFLDDLREKNDLGKVLIVVPSSLIFNWQCETEKFTPKLLLTVFSNKDYDKIGRRLGSDEQMVVITTYGLLLEHEQFMTQYKWKVLIFDEAQNLKNITTKRTSAARSLTAQFKICLTGTPMENHYGEFYSLVDILVPGSLGRIDDFRRQFVNTEMVTREEMDDLKLRIKPLLLRRTKKEILDQLPEKQETKVSIAFEERQKEIYRDIALSYNQRLQEAIAVQGEASVQLQMLTALLRLRQACSDPAALPNVRYDKVPPKIETLLDSVQEIVESGESALVFTQFLQTLEHTAQILRAASVPVYTLHGGIPTKQRQKLLSDFNNHRGGAVLIMTLKTGGVGLNLTKASYVFHLEPWWNPSVENQATDRAHRLGQSKAVQVFRYIMHESLEEKIELLKDRKERKFQTLFSVTEKDPEVGAGGSFLSKSDFDLLLGLN